MTTAFLLGAGFSKALSSKMPLMNELLNDLVFRTEVPTSVQTDLAQCLSYLWTNYPWKSNVEYLRDQASYLELVKEIYQNLSNREFTAWISLSENKERYADIGWQALFAQILTLKKLPVITMNYDTLLERLMVAMSGANLEYPAPLQRLTGIWNQQQQTLAIDYAGLNSYVSIQGHPMKFTGSSISPQLFKLHGSISWYTMDLLDLSSPIYSRDINPYYLEEFPQHEEEYGTLSAVIIPPVSDKSSLYTNKVLRSQWIGALTSLLKCNELYCVGYSFPESDLAMKLFLSKASKNIHKVWIICRSHSQQIWEKIKNYFPSETEFDSITGDTCVEEMAKKFIQIYGEEIKKLTNFQIS